MASKPTEAPGETNVVERRVGTPDEPSLTNAIVDAVAAARGTDPTEVEFKLYEYVDADLVARLAGDPGDETHPTWTLTFAIEELDVTVSRDEELWVAVG